MDGWGAGGGGVGDVDSGAEVVLDFGVEGVDFAGVGGAEVEQDGGGGGDGIDGGAAGDEAGVEGGAGIGGEGEARQGGEGLGEQEDGVGGAGVGPRMSAGAGDGGAEAEAAEGAGDDAGVAGAFKGDGGGNRAVWVVGGWLTREEVAHAAEVPLAFFADIGGKEDWCGRGNGGEAESGDKGEQGGEAGAVVGDAGGEVTRGLGGVFGGGFGGEDGVEVGGDENAGRGWVGREGEFGEGVADVVDADGGEVEVVKAIEEPGGAGGFVEGGRGDAGDFELPGEDLRLVEVEPVEGAMDGGQGGEVGDAALGGRGVGEEGGPQYSTSRRNRPRAGLVGPAAERFCWARMWGMLSGSRRPAPASTKVPTRLRTMLWRNPEPVTR